MPPEAFLLLNRHVNVSQETFSKLVLYHDLLIKWQRRINLISNDTVDDSWSRHFLDSLQLIKYIPDNIENILDFGSGAGFPGMVLAIAGIKNIHVVESDGKKISFLREVSRVTGVNVTIHHDRIENVSIKNISVITARAFSSLDSLLKISSPFLSHETICLFPKGKNYAMEIEDAKKEWSFNCDVLPSVTDNNAVILKISNLASLKNDHRKPN